MHKKRRRIGIAIAWAILVAGIALIAMGAAKGSSGGLGGGSLLMLLAVLVGMFASRILRANRIDAKYVRLKGCGAAFLDSMPPFPG